jgi:hypothetical protein
MMNLCFVCVSHPGMYWMFTIPLIYVYLQDLKLIRR